jgi:hypothetical protein
MSNLVVRLFSTRKRGGPHFEKFDKESKMKQSDVRLVLIEDICL